ncbi:acyltransferase family protein [Lewinella sp. IMCC34183]|uniref:acyltransferase family protein n=1 Tax=Lewinella sp. IMCC34183 TaxID=2248762 RepID=UPI000E259548|nr:acyltransferase family protein [Lewinella sp. IMCC34183]
MSRLRSPDQIKAISIFGVVFIHASVLLGQDHLALGIARNLFRFDVPCFIMLWAFFFERSYARRDREDRRDYTLDRFIDLFKDYLGWSILYFLVLADWGSLTPAKVLTTHFAGYGWSGQYFFIVLFQLLFLFPLIRFIYSRRVLRYLSLAVLSVVLVAYGYAYDHLPDLVQKLGERPFYLWVPCTFAGIALARGKFPPLPAWSWLAVVLIPLEMYLLDSFGRNHYSHATPVVMVTSVLLFASVVQADRWVRGRRARRGAAFLGSRTLIVFLANPLIIHILMPFLPELLAGIRNPGLMLSIALLLTVFVISVCLLIGALRNRVRAALLRPVRTLR